MPRGFQGSLSHWFPCTFPTVLATFTLGADSQGIVWTEILFYTLATKFSHGWGTSSLWAMKACDIFWTIPVRLKIHSGYRMWISKLIILNDLLNNIISTQMTLGTTTLPSPNLNRETSGLETALKSWEPPCSQPSFPNESKPSWKHHKQNSWKRGVFGFFRMLGSLITSK